MRLQDRISPPPRTPKGCSGALRPHHWLQKVQAGSVRGLAVTSLKRSPYFPDLPTVRGRCTANERDELAPLCMTRKEHSERRLGFGHDRFPVATGSPQPLWILIRE